MVYGMREKKTKDLVKILLELQQNKFEVMAWYIFEETMIQTDLTVNTIRKDRGEIVFKASEDSFPYLKQMVSGSEKINFYIPCEGCIFSSDLKNLQNNGLLFVSLPTSHSFLERRAEERVHCDSFIWVSFESEGKKFTKKCHDIGMGGISLLFSKSEKPNINVKQLFSGMKIFWGEQEIIVASQVNGVNKIGKFESEEYPYGGSRIMFKFVSFGKDGKNRLKKLLSSYDGLAKNIESN